ncbi:hypothetical protein [Vibrio neptunius]|uniref:Uncharacterized protein n=1 Tax=Vibrio neptunius TaxID=170651 RepID=A0ABS3A8P9_9VIBR|nr:hypothetical protein [Vibrio neptunius]MBN3495408.1 hypothetical protein [Vibrio neptunius]MBN3552251.1 hypothetical protein [Vibrio neptunius]MBN3580254.1 hypothetical protein [Vibrio neptunius]MCH9873920.1 hypothetical protein [Vibrio neptunius]
MITSVLIASERFCDWLTIKHSHTCSGVVISVRIKLKWLEATQIGGENTPWESVNHEE